MILNYRQIFLDYEHDIASSEGGTMCEHTYKTLFNIGVNYSGNAPAIVENLKILASIREPHLLKWVAFYSAKFYSMLGEKAKEETLFCLRKYLREIGEEESFLCPTLNRGAMSERSISLEDRDYFEDLFVRIALSLYGGDWCERNDFMEKVLFYQPFGKPYPLVAFNEGSDSFHYEMGRSFIFSTTDEIMVHVSEYQIGLFKISDKYSSRNLCDVSPENQLQRAKRCLEVTLQYTTLQLKPTIAIVIDGEEEDDLWKVLWGKFDHTNSSYEFYDTLMEQVKKALAIASWVYHNTQTFNFDPIWAAIDHQFNSVKEVDRSFDGILSSLCYYFAFENGKDLEQVKREVHLPFKMLDRWHYAHNNLFKEYNIDNRKFQQMDKLSGAKTLYEMAQIVYQYTNNLQ